MVLENTFTSLPRVIPAAMPWLGPFAFLCHQKWESYAKVRPRVLFPLSELIEWAGPAHSA